MSSAVTFESPALLALCRVVVAVARVRLSTIDLWRNGRKWLWEHACVCASTWTHTRNSPINRIQKLMRLSVVTGVCVSRYGAVCVDGQFGGRER
uniref:Putative secreted protein n=1 Tax=Anopheles darlingi TaxID=43151 RepID=A0A2M4D3B3_ANODA